jgi:hypothetical protein
MDRRLQKDQLQEGTAKPTAKAGPKPWDMKRYISEKQKDDQSLSHSDPRLDQHQDSEFIPSDGDHGYGYPAFGTIDLNASASTASDQGTLAGGGCISTPEDKQARERKRYLKEAEKSAYNIKSNWTEKDRQADSWYKNRLATRRQTNDINDQRWRQEAMGRRR